MIERQVEIVNRLGLHARAAAKMVHLAGGFTSAIRVAKDGEAVDGKSILGLLLLAAPQGATIRLSCDGEDEEEALTALVDLVVSRFGEDG